MAAERHTVTRKAIRKHAIGSVTDLGTPDGRARIPPHTRTLPPSHQQRHQPGASARFAAEGLLEPSCPESGHGRF